MTSGKGFEPVPPTFSGLIWEPSNEQDVVMLFGMLVALKQFGEPLCIQSCATAFPDCEAINTNTGESIKIEFEYRSSAFECHKKEWVSLKSLGSPVRWMIVCWEDDLGKKADDFPGVEIVSLKQRVNGSGLVQRCIPPDVQGAAARFEWRAAGLPPFQRQVLTHLRRFGEVHDSGFSIEWPTRDDSVKFSITCQRHGGIGFGASAKGTIGIPFSKWHGVSDDVKSLIIGQLNEALPHLDFSGHERPKMGYDITVLLPEGDQEAVGRFL